MPAITVLIKSSTWLFWLVILLHIFTLIAILMYSMTLWRVLWLLCWLGSLVWAWYGYTHGQVSAIVIDDSGQAWLRLYPQYRLVKAQLHHSSLARPSLLVLCWKTQHGTVHQLLLPDMIERLMWRRLQVWVRWCQPTGQHTNKLMNWFRTLKIGKSQQ